LTLITIVGLLVQLSLYLVVAKPINTKMTEAAQQKEILSDIRELQNRWDSVIVARAMAMTLAVSCLVTAASLR
jgi:formate-dependent nitrite reductase cytochrome c552 subunit